MFVELVVLLGQELSILRCPVVRRGGSHRAWVQLGLG